jgi:hypothetical protein
MRKILGVAGLNMSALGTFLPVKHVAVRKLSLRGSPQPTLIVPLDREVASATIIDSPQPSTTT